MVALKKAEQQPKSKKLFKVVNVNAGTAEHELEKYLNEGYLIALDIADTLRPNLIALVKNVETN